MTFSDHIDIVNAVRDALNAGTFSMEFTARRKYVDTLERTQVDPLEVIVYPTAETLEIVNRFPTSQHDYGVAVAMRAVVDVSRDDFDDEDIDKLLLVAEQIKDRLRDAGQMASATLVAMAHEPLWSDEALVSRHIFLSEMQFTYRLHRNRNA